MEIITFKSTKNAASRHVYNLPLTSTRRAYKPPNGCNGGAYWKARKRAQNVGTIAAVRRTSCNGCTQGASLAACPLRLWNAANVYQYAASIQGARMRVTHGTSRAALAIRVPCLCTLYGVHWGTCARLLAYSYNSLMMILYNELTRVKP